jgi:tetratricopeptide (TPR) repeat protein
MLKEALSNSGFNNFVWIEKFYDYNRHTDILCAELDKLDNFIIVWDDLHYVSDQDNIRKTLEQIDKFAKMYNKRYKFIGCSRSDIYLGPYIKPEVIKLERFTNVKLVEFCAEYYKVKLDGVSPDEILEKSDGTPLYIISLFARFKEQGKIGRSDLEKLPNKVIELWQDYIRYLKNQNKLTFGHIDALRSIALVSHASPFSTKKEIQEVFNKVFNSQGNVDHYLQDLCDLSLVTRLEIDGYKYYMHDAHAEAVESLEECRLDKDIVEKFVKIIADINKLKAISNWMVKKFKTARSYAEYLLIIANKILELDNSAAEAWNNKGVVYSEMKKYNEALECYNKALNIDPYFAKAWYNKGVVYFEMKEYDEAIKCYEEAINIDPYFAEAWNNKGLVYDEMGKYNEALECYNKALNIDPYFAEAWNNKGLVYDEMKEYDEAIKCYNKALNIDPYYAKAWNNKGLVYDEMGKYNEALECYNKALNIDPYFAKAWNNKGVVYYKMKEYDEAIKCYNKALEINPYFAEAWNNKGLVYDEMGKYNEALECYNKALNIDPYFAKAWYNKGVVYYKMKEYDEAIKCYNKALEINPYYAKAWNNKGVVYFEMKEYDEASKCFMIALSLFIINQEHIELIPKLLNFIIENSKDEVIKAEARAIRATLLYLSKYLPKEEYIKKLNSLKKTPRIEVLIDAIINKKDTPMEIKDVVDEAFDLLKKQVLRSI